MIVEARIFGEPVEHIRLELLDTKGLFTRKPDGETHWAYNPRGRGKSNAGYLFCFGIGPVRGRKT